MADVFISYAKADRSLALKLAAMLEAEGWKTWWDTSLTIGDDFRNEIMTELGRARAVIVIWTDASIKSDWVRSEAGRAQADRKLIPVKLAHLTYRDLPPPFDVLHTENVGEEDKIRAAVVAQLAKPAVEPSAVALLTKGFKYELLTWFGIVGGALTLFTNFSSFLKLADWARLLVQHWKEWTNAFWVWAFGWLGIHLPPEWTPVLSFLLFAALLTIGQVLRLDNTIRSPSMTNEGKRFEDTSFPRLHPLELRGPGWLFMFILIILASASGWSLSQVTETLPRISDKPFYSYGTIVIIVLMLGLYLRFARRKLHTAIALFLIVIFWTIIAFNQLLATPNSASLAAAFAMIIVLPPLLLSIAPAKAVTRRLIFLGLGLILLIALNELSKLGLDVSAPKLQG
jgi:hypothetical protein